MIIQNLPINIGRDADGNDIVATYATKASVNNTFMPLTGGTISGDIVPDTAGTRNLGTESAKFKEVWADEVHISQNTLYIGDVPVIGSNADTIIVNADHDQSLQIKTSGEGLSQITSESGVTVSSTGINSGISVSAKGANSTVAIAADKAINIVSESVNIDADTTIKNLTVTGTTTTVNSEDLKVKDNVIELNSGETGNGVSKGSAGIKVNRGDALPYLIQFDESDDLFKVGEQGDLEVIASRPYVDNAVGTKANDSEVTHKSGDETISGTKTFSSQIVGSIDKAEKDKDGNIITSTYATKSEIPTKVSDLTNDSGFAHSADLSKVATSGSYDDLSDKPTIPTVNNATLTIQKNGTTVNTFTANASSNVICNILVPTKVSDLTNDSGFVSDLSSHYTKSETDALLDGKSETTHNHNSLYLGISAKAESAKSADSVAWANVSDKPGTYTPSSHNHDDRYYTESEVDAKLGEKSNADHTHSEYLTEHQDISGKADKSTTLSGYGITDAYTKTQVDTKIADLVSSAPETLDTLNELASALGNDPNFATTIATQIGSKANNSDVVHKSGDETIGGVKTFTSQIKGTIDESKDYYLSDGTLASANGSLGTVEYYPATSTADLDTEIFEHSLWNASVVSNSIPTALDTFYYIDQYFYSNRTATSNRIQILRGYRNANLHMVRVYNGQTNSWSEWAKFVTDSEVYHYGVCSTAAATAEKVVSITDFVLKTGATVFVKFTVNNTADANTLTLNVNNTGAKKIFWRGAQTFNAGYIGENRVLAFVYDGTNWEIIGELDTSTSVVQSVTTTDDTYPILMSDLANATENRTSGVRFGSGVKINPSTSTIYAATFSGDVDFPITEEEIDAIFS